MHTFNTPTDFEREWKKILTEFKVMDNECLAHIFKIRDMWVPTYLKTTIFGGMSTTQRIESMNAFAKHFVEYKKHTS